MPGTTQAARSTQVTTPRRHRPTPAKRSMQRRRSPTRPRAAGGIEWGAGCVVGKLEPAMRVAGDAVEGGAGAQLQPDRQEHELDPSARSQENLSQSLVHVQNAEEVERNNLVGACWPLVETGRVKLYSVDSVAGALMLAKQHSVEHRMWLLNQFHDAIAHEVTPAMRLDSGGYQGGLIAAGALFLSPMLAQTIAGQQAAQQQGTVRRGGALGAQ